MAILAVDSVGNVSCISELFNQKWLKCLYRIFMQSFFFAPVNLQIVSIKYIQNQQNRKLWGNDISIFQMFHACEDERLIAEVLIGFVLSCGHKKCISSVLMCSLQREIISSVCPLTLIPMTRQFSSRITEFTFII